MALKQSTSRTLWRKADTLRLTRMAMTGLAVGLFARYLYVTAPPLPVLAASPTIAASTNAPLPTIKSEGASPSVRD